MCIFLTLKINSIQVGSPLKSEEASAEESYPLPAVFRDENKNIFFDIWVLRGRENRLMSEYV